MVGVARSCFGAAPPTSLRVEEQVLQKRGFKNKVPTLNPTLAQLRP